MRLHNRQIKATFWNDPDLLQWPKEKRWFYLGLVQLADDSGCLENSPFAFKIQLFPSPLDADITPELLAQWVGEMIEQGKLRPYTVNGKQYLYITNFHKHQTPDYPTPPSKASIPLPPWVQWVENGEKKRKGRYIVVENPGETPPISQGNPGETPPINITGTVTGTINNNLLTCASSPGDARAGNGQSPTADNPVDDVEAVKVTVQPDEQLTNGRAAGQDPGESVEAETVTATPGEQRAKTPLENEGEGWVRFWGIPKVHYVRCGKTLCGKYKHNGEAFIDQPDEFECCGICLKKLNKTDGPRSPFTSKRQEQLFDQFWQLYPKKKNKGQAEKVLARLRPNDKLFAAIMAGLERAKASYDWQKEGGKYIPYPAKWLNAKGWEDEYTPAEEMNRIETYRQGFIKPGVTKSLDEARRNRFADLYQNTES